MQCPWRVFWRITQCFRPCGKMWKRTTDSEIRAWGNGVDATMNCFNFLFGLVFGERLLKHNENRTLDCIRRSRNYRVDWSDTFAYQNKWSLWPLLREGTRIAGRDWDAGSKLAPKEESTPHTEVSTGNGYHPSTPKEHNQRHVHRLHQCSQSFDLHKDFEHATSCNSF